MAEDESLVEHLLNMQEFPICSPAQEDRHKTKKGERGGRGRVEKGRKKGEREIGKRGEGREVEGKREEEELNNYVQSNILKNYSSNSFIYFMQSQP